MILDMVVTGAIVATASGVQRLDIGVQDGKFAALGRPGSFPEARVRVDAQGFWLLPGAVDAHVHFRSPAYSKWETFTTGSSAAAAGGVTTVMEMPVSTPSVADVDTLRARRDVGEKESVVDFALYAAGAISEPDVTVQLAREGAAALKIYTIALPAERAKDYIGLEVAGNGALCRALETSREAGLRCSVHCEDDDLAAHFTQQLQAQGRRDPRAHSEGRPPITEEMSVARVLQLARHTGAAVHIAHLSTLGGLSLVTQARETGVDVTVETAPHYLSFTEDDWEAAGPYGKMNPPLRSHEHREGLWEALASGVIDAVASDHGPFSIEDKEPGWEDIWRVPPGIPGIEMTVPVIMSGVLEGRLSLERAAAVLAENPARVFGLPGKGRIVTGYDADFFLFDPQGEKSVDIRDLHTRAKGCARLYEGLNLKGRIHATYVRGEPIFLDGTILGAAGYGRFVPGPGGAVS